MYSYIILTDPVSLLAGQRTCDSEVVGSSPGSAPLRSGLGQATYTCVPLSPSSIIWYRPRGVISLAGKVTADLVESNGSLPTGLWLMSPAGWLPRNRDQLRAPRSLIAYGTTSLFVILTTKSLSVTKQHGFRSHWSVTSSLSSESCFNHAHAGAILQRRTRSEMRRTRSVCWRICFTTTSRWQGQWWTLTRRSPSPSTSSCFASTDS